jgi:hypothetical protein
MLDMPSAVMQTFPDQFKHILAPKFFPGHRLNVMFENLLFCTGDPKNFQGADSSLAAISLLLHGTLSIPIL